MPKPRLLIVGDFAVHSGFARVNESLAWHLRDRWDIGVLAVNYHGDHTPLQRLYHLYPAWLGGDAHGFGRAARIVQVEQPDAILLVCDPWHVADYMAGIATCEPMPPVVLYTPVDATSIPRAHATAWNLCRRVVAYTQFGAVELQRAGCASPISIIPHGIDRTIFHPTPQAEARRRLGIDDDRFIVLVADRNQGRKRLDLAFDAFARFAAGRDGVCLAYHGAPDEDVGWNVEHMATDFGIADKFALTVRDMQPLAGVGPRVLSLIYSAADIKLSTTSGEGWGLTTMEAMSCGLPCIVPDAAALGEWTQGAAWCVPAPIRTRHVKINTVGRVPEVGAVEAALIDLYDHPETRADLSRRGLELVSRPEYDWANIADDFDTLLRRAMYPPSPLKGGEAGPIAVEQMAEALC